MNFSTLFRTKENLSLDKNTLTILRYIAIFGQFLAISIVYFYLQLPFPIDFSYLIILIGLGTKWKIGSSFYIASLFGTAMTDVAIFFTGIMDQWMEVINADSDKAPEILQQTSANLIHFKPLFVIIILGIFLWLIAKKIANNASIESSNGRSCLVASYVLQTTLIVDGIFVCLAIIQPSLSGLV